MKNLIIMLAITLTTISAYPMSNSGEMAGQADMGSGQAPSETDMGSGQTPGDTTMQSNEANTQQGGIPGPSPPSGNQSGEPGNAGTQSSQMGGIPNTHPGAMSGEMPVSADTQPSEMPSGEATQPVDPDTGSGQMQTGATDGTATNSSEASPNNSSEAEVDLMGLAAMPTGPGSSVSGSVEVTTRFSIAGACTAANNSNEQ